MSKQNIVIKDFDLFCEVLKSTSKIVDSAKFTITSNGLEIYGARNKVARCEILSNSVTSDDNIEFSIENLSLFLKVAMSVHDIHAGDYSGLKFYVDLPFIRFQSKKFKTKFATCNECLIAPWISKKVTTEMTPIFQFISTSDMIKRLNSHSFMFSSPKDTRIYIETQSEMENNSVFATLGNKETALNNEVTLKLGIVTSGSLIERDDNDTVIAERHIVLDFERLNMFNAIQSDSIKISLMNVNCLVSKTVVTGKNGSFFDLTIYSTILKN